MADIQSSFKVKVSAEGAQGAQQALDKLNAAVGQSTAKQQVALTGTVKSMARMSRLADELIGKFGRLDGLMRSMGRSGRGMSGMGGGVVADGTRAFSGTVSTTSGGGESHTETHKRHRQAASGAIPSAAEAAVDNRFLYRPKTSGVLPLGIGVGVGQGISGTQAAFLGANVQHRYITPTAPKPRNWGAFGHGLMQGIMPGTLGFIQRGPGAMMQGAGMMAGNVASSLMTMPFMGAAGLGGAAGALGSLVSAPLSRYMGNAGQAIGFERQQMENAPLLGGYGGFDANPAESPAMRADAMRYARSQAAAATRRGAGSGTFAGMFGSPAAGAVSPSAYLDEGMRRARSRTQNAAVTQAGAMGSSLMGADLGASQQFAAQLAASGAGTARAAGAGFIGTAMAARTAMGISPETSGAFALGSRSNAVTGGGNATQTLLDVIQQTRDLGLEGSDAQQYLQQMAEGIRQFQQSGMPLQKDSIYGITRGLTGVGGMTTMQAQRAAFAMQGRGQSLYDSGPQSSMDLAILQRGGFKGGIDSLLGTERKLAGDSGAYAQSFMDVLPDLTRSNSRETRIHSVYQALKEAGISSDIRVAEALEQQMGQNGGKVPQQFAAALASGRSGGGSLTAEGLQGQAAAMVPQSARATAAMSNQSLAMGSGASAVAIEMDATANDAAQVMSRFAGLLMRLARTAHQATNMVTGNDDGMAPGMAPVN